MSEIEIQNEFLEFENMDLEKFLIKLYPALGMINDSLNLLKNLCFGLKSIKPADFDQSEFQHDAEELLITLKYFEKELIEKLKKYKLMEK